MVFSPLNLQSGWKPAVFKNPFSQRDSISESSRGALASPPVDTSSIAVSRIPANQQLAAMPPLSHQLPSSVPQLSLPQTPIDGLQPHHLVHSHHQGIVANFPGVQLLNSEIASALRSFPITNIPLANQSTVAAPSSVRIEGGNVAKPVSFSSNTPERVISIPFQSPPSPTPTRMLPNPMQQQRQSQLQQLQPFQSEHLHQTRVNIEKSAPSLGSWRPRQQDTGSHQNNERKLVGGPSWGRNEFESWSPENSPVRPQPQPQEYSRPDKSFSEPRINSGRSYGPAEQHRHSQSQRSPYGYREQNRHGGNNSSRRWRDRQY